MESVEIDEEQGANRPALVIALSVSLGLFVAVLGVLGAFIGYLVGLGTGAVAGVVLVGAVAGLAVGVFVFLRSRQDNRYWSTTTLSADGITRSSGAFSVTVPWDEVGWIGMVEQSRQAGDVLMIRTEPPTRLVAPVRRLQYRANLSAKVYGGLPIIQMKALPLSEVELGEKVSTLSGGRHTLVRRERSVR